MVANGSVKVLASRPGDTTVSMASRERRLLIIEDDGALATALSMQFQLEGFSVVIESRGDRALAVFREEQPALVLLDLMLPGATGLDVCRQLRAESTVPIIIVSAKDTEVDKVTALELGADDYLTKPFSMPELISRVRARLRRSAEDPITLSHDANILTTSDIVLDIDRHEVIVGGVAVNFSWREFVLLEALLRAHGRLMTIAELGTALWGPGRPDDPKVLHAYIQRIRKKIEDDASHPKHLLTVRGLGYRMVD